MINDKKHTATITDCQIVAATWGIGVCKAEISAAATWLRKGYEVAFIYANVQPERLIAAPYGGPEKQQSALGMDTFCTLPVERPRHGVRTDWKHPTDRKKGEVCWFALAMPNASRGAAFYALCKALRQQHEGPKWLEAQVAGRPIWPIDYTDVNGKKRWAGDKPFDARRTWIQNAINRQILEAKAARDAKAAKQSDAQRLAVNARKAAAVARKEAKRLAADESRAAKAMLTQASKFEREANAISKKLEKKSGKWATSEARGDLQQQRMTLLDMALQMRANAAKLQKQATTDGNAFDNSTKRSLAAQQQEEAEWAADQRRLRAARQAS